MTTVLASALGAAPDLYTVLVLASTFAAVVLFVMAGVRILAGGWQSYEQRYLSEAERSLDAIYLTIPPQHVLYLSVVCFLVLLALWLWLFGRVGAAVGLALPGLAVPKLVLWRLKVRRDAAFDRQLVEALVNLGNSLKAGFSLPQALQLLTQEAENPMRQEMGLVVREMQVGADMDEALRHLYERMPTQDLDLVITAISISREVGGDLTEVFDNIAGTIRERHRIEGKIKALAAQGKLQAFVICCMPPAMFLALYYIAPGMVEPLYSEPLGWALMALIALLMGVGIHVIYRIVAIEV